MHFCFGLCLSYLLLPGTAEHASSMCCQPCQRLLRVILAKDAADNCVQWQLLSDTRLPYSPGRMLASRAACGIARAPPLEPVQPGKSALTWRQPSLELRLDCASPRLQHLAHVALAGLQPPDVVARRLHDGMLRQHLRTCCQ